MPFVWERQVLGFSDTRFVQHLFKLFRWSGLKSQASVERFHLARTKVQRCLGLSTSEHRVFVTKLLIQAGGIQVLFRRL